MASQITSVSIVYSNICSCEDKKKIKARRHWPLWGEFTSDRWIPRTKGQRRGKCSNLMTSSCFILISVRIWWHRDGQLLGTVGNRQHGTGATTGHQGSQPHEITCGKKSVSMAHVLCDVSNVVHNFCANKWRRCQRNILWVRPPKCCICFTTNRAPVKKGNLIMNIVLSSFLEFTNTKYINIRFYTRDCVLDLISFEQSDF